MTTATNNSLVCMYWNFLIGKLEQQVFDWFELFDFFKMANLPALEKKLRVQHSKLFIIIYIDIVGNVSCLLVAFLFSAYSKA